MSNRRSRRARPAGEPKAPDDHKVTGVTGEPMDSTASDPVEGGTEAVETQTAADDTVTADVSPARAESEASSTEHGETVTDEKVDEDTEGHTDLVASQASPASDEPIQAEDVPEAETIVVPIALLKAALLVNNFDVNVPAFAGVVYLHKLPEERVVRIVATDSRRMMIASHDLPENDDGPSWLGDGLNLSAERLKPRLAMLEKDSTLAAITWSKGMGKATLASTDDADQFRIDVPAVTFPDYVRAIFGEFKSTDEFQPVGMNSTYLKGIGDMAKVVEQMFAKQDRVKEPIVRVYQSGEDQPLWIEFRKGVMLCICQTHAEGAPMSGHAKRVLEPAVTKTLAALRAHETRNREWAKQTTNEAERQAFTEKADGFAARVSRIMQSIDGKAIEDKSGSDDQPKPDDAQEPTADGETEGDTKGTQGGADDAATNRMAA